MFSSLRTFSTGALIPFELGAVWDRTDVWKRFHLLGKKGMGSGNFILCITVQAFFGAAAACIALVMVVEHSPVYEVTNKYALSGLRRKPC